MKNVIKMANRGKTEHVDAVKRNKNVVEIGAFTTLIKYKNQIISSNH